MAGMQADSVCDSDSSSSPCVAWAGPCTEETGYQHGQPGLKPVTELQGEAEARLLPWSNGGKRGQELRWLDACPIY